MNLNREYQNSNLKKILDYLFAPKEYFKFSESFIGRWLNYINQPIFSAFLIFSACFLIIYQNLLPSYFNYLPLPLVLLGLILSDKSQIKITKSTYWLILFIFVMTISSIFAIYLKANPIMTLLGWLVLIQFSLAFVSGQIIKKENIFKFISVIIAPVAIFGLYQFFLGVETSSTWVSDLENISFRAYSFVNNPNIFGMISLIGFIASMTLVLEKNKRYIYLIPIYLGAIIISFSRTAWLGLILVIAFFAIIYGKKYLKYSPLTLLIFLIPQIRERVMVIFNPTLLHYSSLDGRIWAIKNGLYVWQKKPIFGFGPGSYGGEIARNFASPVYLKGIQEGYTALYFSDNNYISLLVQTGLVGFLFFLGFFISIFSTLINTFFRMRNTYILSTISLTLFLLVGSFFANIFEFGIIIIPSMLMIGSVVAES